MLFLNFFHVTTPDRRGAYQWVAMLYSYILNVKRVPRNLRFRGEGGNLKSEAEVVFLHFLQASLFPLEFSDQAVDKPLRGGRSGENGKTAGGVAFFGE